MKKQFTLLILLLFAGMGITELRGQSIVLKKKDGTEQIKQLSTLKRVTFSNDNLMVNYLGEPAETYSLSTISKLYFNFVSTGTENTTLSEVAKTITIYPNPVNNIIYIQNTSEVPSNVLVYRMDGIMVLHTHASTGIITVDVSNLANGPYLIKVNNQTFKFVKL